MLKKVSLLSALATVMFVPTFANEAFLVNYFNDLATIQADFEQTVIQQKNKEISSGELKIRKKTAKNSIAGFYFDYTMPFEQKLISDGKKLWHYDVDLEQVVIKNLANFEQDSPMFMIFNNQSLNTQFEIKTLKNESKYRLTPKKKGDISSIEIEFNKGNISKVSAKQTNGSLDLKLSNVKMNANINNSVFTLKVPKGVDVIDETK
ncbi:outer membrane lipoprotein chaperone LolA [Wohlfahrtiimonas larvae]|uniref:Outer-membrane lipoprotein carrier protein n=1 Tax=Wohlfahrtiimonas larvae TaxID=1157986 RepID=A0ABP9N019_9GAMM|nr:outer membrane lipoprotein chaperone LolA [Wohlfahrtiimonas larvae]